MQPDTMSYTMLMRTCEKAGAWQAALAVFSEMLLRNQGSEIERGQGRGSTSNARCVPDSYTYSALVSACVQGEQWETAADAFDGTGQGREWEKRGWVHPLVWKVAVLAVGTGHRAIYAHTGWPVRYGWLRITRIESGCVQGDFNNTFSGPQDQSYARHNM